MDRIEFEHVSKRYALGERRNARETIAAAAQRLARGSRKRVEHVWSLCDVNFAVADGDALGVIGANGAGKSTILRILAGITVPTEGVARTRGRVAALLEVGTGFHGELTGRENIYLSGAILGMSRRDIARTFDQIVDFSGVERFLDTPVKRYSSGMYLRLAFAVAAHLEPDILVVDEILAVGDAEFQRKCLGRMEEAGSEGRTVVFVSHDLDALGSLCRRALWIDSGRVVGDGPTRQVIQSYLESTTGAALEADLPAESGAVRIRGVRATGPDSTSALLMRDDPLRLEVDIDIEADMPGVDIAVSLTTPWGVRLIDEAYSDITDARLLPGSYRIRLDIPPLLNVGDYLIGLWVGTPYEDLLYAPNVARFTLHGSDGGRPARALVLESAMTVDIREAQR